ncbi:MAG TPA: hypothetical protein EYP09_11990 [Anaerolineae bacterium]|nr:hypothetical protein [Anaerolineae bacterium]
MKIALGLTENLFPLADRLARKYEVEIAGVLTEAAALRTLVESTPPEAVVLADNLRGAENLLALIGTLQKRAQVLVLAGEASAARQEELKARGIPSVWMGLDLEDAIARALGLTRRPIKGQLTIVPANVKGGVGKTTLAVNLAVAAKKENPSLRVLLLDAHPEGDAGPSLGVTDGPTLADLAVARPEGVSSLAEVRPFIQTHRSGVDLIIASSRLGKSVVPDRRQFLSLMRELKQHYHLIVVDTDTDLHRAPTILALAEAEVILLVTTPGNLSMRGLLKLKPVLNDMGLLKRARIVLNMVHGAVDAGDLAGALGVPVIAAIPYDLAFQEAEDSFRPVVEYDPGGKAAGALRRLARTLLEEAR